MYGPDLEPLIVPTLVVVGLVGWGVVEFVLWMSSHVSFTWS